MKLVHRQPFAKISGCTDNGFNYPGNDIVTMPESVDTEFICQKKCQSNNNCKFWSWSGDKLCFLKDGEAVKGRLKDRAFVSGLVQCPGKKLEWYFNALN